MLLMKVAKLAKFLGLFLIIPRLLSAETWNRWSQWIAGAAALAILGGLAKPSYNICVVPSLALLLAL